MMGRFTIHKFQPGSTTDPEVVFNSIDHKWCKGAGLSTAIAAGPDGSIIFAKGASFMADATILKFLSKDEEPEVLLNSKTHPWFKGLSSQISIAMSSDGNLLVFQ